MKETEKILKGLLKKHGFRLIKTVRNDGFERFNSVLKDVKGNKFFMKATLGKKTYRYNSLYNEAVISDFLSKMLIKRHLINNGYRLQVPEVKKIIEDKNFLIFISDFSTGKKLSLYEKGEQAKILKNCIELITKLDNPESFQAMDNRFKKYDRARLLMLSPLRLGKAALFTNVPLRKLVKVYYNFLAILFVRKVKNSLVHPDINTTNIIVYGKKIYLTDWEEAGWGVSKYNATTPLLLYENDSVLSGEIHSIFKNLPRRMLKALLSYRILVLFNQKTNTEDKRYKRDLLLINKFMNVFL
jgi:hypothetical protein